MFLKSLVNKLRYLVWASPIVWLTLLNGCGSGTVLDPFTPTRIIAFGDAYMDVRTPRFTVNDEIPTNLASTSYTYAFNTAFTIKGYLVATINEYAPGIIGTGSTTVDTAINPQLTIIERIAADYGFSSAVIPMSTIFSTNATWVVPSTSGVYSFAEGNALVKDLTGTTSGDQQTYTTTPVTYNNGSGSLARSVESQIKLFLTNNGSFSSTDLVIINGGTADVLLNTVGTGGTGITTAADNLVALVSTARANGAKHIVVFGPPNMGRSPFAYANSLKQTLTDASLTLSNGSTSCTDFNCKLELGLQRLVGTVSQNPILYVDISSQTSLITGSTATGSANTYTSYSDTLYGIVTAYPGDTTYQDSSPTPSNYYCNNANVGTTAPFFITSASPAITAGSTTSITPSPNNYCYANTSVDYRTYAYADQIYFAPSVNRMLGDFIIGKLSLASWK